MTFLVFGSTGQVGTELRLQSPNSTFLGRNQAGLNNPATCAAAIRSRRPKAVINAAAWTAVDKAEAEEAQALTINGAAVAAMATACAELGIPLVHISTDYVFDGAGETPFSPDHPTAPLGAYGRTKLAGENAVRASGAPHAILRTSWVFSAHGSNFVKTMLRLGAERKAVNVVADQVGGPTPARDIARACLVIAERLTDDPSRSGTYHFSGAPDVSWADFARAIFVRAAVDCTVHDIPTSAYPTPAVRPLNSRLDCATLGQVFGISRPDWASGLDKTLQELNT